MGRLTTHVLDTAAGAPASGVRVVLADESGATLAQTRTNSDGRCDAPLLADGAFRAGTYVLTFAIGAYYRARDVPLPEPAFLEDVVIRFGVADAAAHYHVPLLVSPFGYSTYRGS